MLKKNTKLSIIDKIHIKCDVIDGSIQNGLRQPLLFSFVLDKKQGYKVFSENKTLQKKTNKSVWNTITFYLEDDNNEEDSFEINLKRIVFVLVVDTYLLQKTFMGV